MVSEASWQRRGPARPSGVPHAQRPMEQHSVESLLCRLIERIEDNERRYGRALDDLHARLDRLSHTTEAARASVASASDDRATLDRLHDQVSKLARRLEQEASSPLDDFERLGKALSGGMDYSTGASGFSGSAPEDLGTSPYASRPLLETPVGTEPPFSYWVPEPPYSPPPESSTGKFSSTSEDRDLDKRLIDVAHRLERSIETTMSTAVLEALNARLDEIGNQINQALLRTPRFPSFEPLEVQISDLAHKLARAEEQLARISSIESELHSLIARVDASPSDAEEVIGRVAGEAARLAVAEAKQSTAERLDAMHRDLMAMNDRTRANDERLADSIIAVQESLKQLALQVERSASQPAQPRRSRPVMAEPAHSEAEKPQWEIDKVGHHPLAEFRTDKGLARDSAGAKAPAKPKTLRTKLSAAPAMERAKATPHFERLKQLRPADDSFDLDTPMANNPVFDRGQGETFETPAELIEAARRAAHAAARKEEEKVSLARTGSVTAAINNASTSAERRPIEKRSLLIVAAAILLAISAAFLYERLMSKPELEILPPVIEQSAPAETPPAQSDSWAPLTQPQEGPDKNAASDGRIGNFTEITKSSYRSTTEDAAEPEPAWLGQGSGASLPPGVVFSIEDPSKSQAAPAEAVPSAPPTADLDPPEATNPELIARAQMLLNKLGYDAGTPDGHMDARMREAILSFERNNGLQETGTVTIQLVTMLERLTS
jgi:localization factor PodJL